MKANDRTSILEVARSSFEAGALLEQSWSIREFLMGLGFSGHSESPHRWR